MQARHAQNSNATTATRAISPASAKPAATPPAKSAAPVATRAAKAEKQNGKTVEFTFTNPNARSVSVAGTFNNWDFKQAPMQKGDGGAWKAKVSVPPGRHEYRFVVDGQWVSDPNAHESVQNAYGSTNSVISAK
jgi:1,4-alpha-glucan branching enzyme